MKIGFGSDHAGVELKLTLMDYLREKAMNVSITVIMMPMTGMMTIRYTG